MSAQEDTDFAVEVIDACVRHARSMLASQMPSIETHRYDLIPQMKETTIQLYLAGVMWRFGEQFHLPTPARDRAFICLLSMLTSEGMVYKKAQKRIKFLNQISLPDGKDALPVTLGYQARESDGTLAKLLDHYNDLPEASGAPYRLVAQAKPIAAILAFTGFAVTKLLGTSWFMAIGIGLILGFATVSIAVIIFNHMTKPRAQA